MAYVTSPTRVVSVIFTDSEDKGLPSSGREYHYFVPPFITVEINSGDHVVVETHGKLKLVRVVDVIPAAMAVPGKVTKAIAGTVDDKAYRREAERKAEIDRTIAALLDLKRKHEEREQFAALARIDNEAGVLLTKLERLERNT